MRGRKPIYKTPEQMQEQIDLYFESKGDKVCCDDNGNAILDKNGNPCIISHPPTVAELSLFLGFADRTSLYNYKDKPEFSDTIKKAITRIESYAEEHLYIGKATGAIFWLKNHGWKDETKQEISGSVNVMPCVQIDGVDLEFDIGEDVN